MKKVSDVFKSIRYAKLDPNHDKGPKGSSDDEEHYTVGEKEYSQQLTHVKKRAMMNTEAKDESEYGYEGDMAINQLNTIMRHSQYLIDMMDPDTDLPEWVQSKITLATDYIQTACDYMTSEMKEENMSHQSKTTMKHIPNASPALKKAAKDIKPGIKGYTDRIAMLKAGGVKEEVDQIDELSSDLLGRYKKAAGADANKADKAGDYKKGNKRFGGIMNATKKQFANDMKKEEVVQEREDDEYHTPTRHHVQVQISKGDGPKEHRKATVRAKEPSHAVSAAISHYKQQGYTVHDHKYLGEETIQEGRPSQRHPLEGHEYHKKSNDALIHIAKDAHAAAEAMKGHNTDAENKYRDQANDSATVRHFRKTSGMPEWYKKKYGHMKEEKDTTPPFDGPYTKTSPVTTDKSGAKHGPMSVARHLAKQAMQRQSASLKKPVKEQAMSNKAKIVKDAAKKKKTGESEDAFQSEPIMTKSPTKNY
jgi:hypothetical protein